MITFAHGHALIVGVGTYQDSKWNAPITLADAQGVAAALQDPRISAYPSEQVRLLSHAQASRAGITTALQHLADSVTPEDTVFLFFCGHGAPGTDGTYYFATHETSFSDGKIQAGTGLSGPDLLNLLRAIPAQKLLFIINACFSGHLNPTLGMAESLGAPPPTTLGLEMLATGEGRVLITASRPSQYSYYSHAQKRTYFGQALVDGLHGKGIVSNSTYVGLYELYQHLYRGVTQTVAGINQVQEPMLTILQGVGPFPVALYPEATPGNLHSTAVQQTPPDNMAVEVVPRTAIHAAGQGSTAFNIHSGSAVNLDQRRGIDFGTGNVMGNVTLRDVTSGNITRINIQSNATDVKQGDAWQQLIDHIDTIQADIAALIRQPDAPEDELGDVSDELRKAREAAAKQNHQRLLGKLRSAQEITHKLSSTLPDASKIARAIGAIIQHAREI